MMMRGTNSSTCPPRNKGKFAVQGSEIWKGLQTNAKKYEQRGLYERMREGFGHGATLTTGGKLKASALKNLIQRQPLVPKSPWEGGRQAESLGAEETHPATSTGAKIARGRRR
ncbi:hypothetical protein F511_43602 [Dorcoceras hygrometricum]|uniref:Uncharacterized protein n=1 Tax=Dorcoceras hygrometricum TaxID=472368 RepID=A0A2Z6ZYK6_9LAMI|nr:hypothetical protein F511_43602 [Dorcoceras hygrometricum]